MPPLVTVTQLYVYPVKSCAGLTLDRADIGARGIRHDREFLVTTPGGEFLTQREMPRLALVRPRLIEGGLELTGPNMPTIQVSVREGQRRSVTIWGDTVAANDQGDEVADWFSTQLDRACRLVHLPAESIRRVDPEYAVSPDNEVGFADAYPILVLSEESVEDLNSRLDQPLPMNRFRPNIVVRGWGSPYGEDTWSDIAIGDVQLRPVKACARCIIMTTDQSSGERGAEPLATLTGYRRIPRGVIFGQNAIPLTFGQVAIGNELVIVAGPQRAADSPM
ncbi:MAG: MOSC domain-containing protein [Chloroflexota bacterium]